MCAPGGDFGTGDIGYSGRTLLHAQCVGGDDNS